MKRRDDEYENYRVAVPAEFEELFSHFYFAKNQSEKTIVKKLLPSYQTILIFSFGTTALLHTQQNTRVEIKKCLVLGPVKNAFDYSLPPGSEILVINFKNDAFYRFFGNASVAENLPVDPDSLLSENCFTALWTELCKITDIPSRVNYLLEFCKPYLHHRSLVAGQLSSFSNQALNPIKSVAGKNKQTERNIQLHHKKYFGYSAKEIHRYQRFLKAVELIENIVSGSKKTDWFEIISECGYYDQSQLIKDFKYYIHLSPAKYLKFQQDICNPAS